MSDISMNVDETLELDAIIEEWSGSGSIVDLNGDESSFNVSGIQTKTSILDPQETGNYTITINGQDLSVQVNDTNTIPDSAIANGAASDYDGSQWVANIGPNIPDVLGTPTQVQRTINGTTYDAVRYEHSDDDGSQTTNLSVSSGPQAVIYTVINRTPDPSFSDSNYIDGNGLNEFSHVTNNTVAGSPHRVLSGSSDVQGDDADSNIHTFCLEGNGSTLRLLRDGTVILSDSNGFDLLSGLTLGINGRLDSGRSNNVDVFEYTVLEGHTQSDRDNEINRHINKFA